MTALVALIGQPGWAETIQFFSFVSIVPLGLLLLRKNYAAANFEAIAWLAAPSAAAFAGIGYLFTPGPLAALWATPWLLVTAVVAAGGILRAIDRPWPIDHHLLSAAAEVFLLVGGFWFWFSRAGMNPGGFSDQIVTLTGIHFHYTGFAMPLALAQIGTAKPNRNVNIAAIGILIGIPATALGITIGGWAELIGGNIHGSRRRVRSRSALQTCTNSTHRPCDRPRLCLCLFSNRHDFGRFIRHQPSRWPRILNDRTHG